MLDAAAYLPTNQLDLVESGADFVSMSFYKVPPPQPTLDLLIY